MIILCGNPLEWIGDGLSAAADFVGNIVGVGADILTDAWNGIARPIVDGAFRALGFEDEDIYSTQVSTIRLVPDEDLPDNSLALAILRSVREESSIIDNIQRTVLTNPQNSLNHFTAYGERKYTHGLPTVVGGFTQINPDEVIDIIETIEGETVSLVTLFTGIPANTHWVKYYLQENESYTQDDHVIIVGATSYLYNGYIINGAGKFDVQLAPIGAEFGQHDGSGAASILSDSTKSWTPGAFVGDTITNTTDNSSGTVTANTATTVTATLTGNDWDVDDTYTITSVANTPIGYLIDPPLSEIYYYTKYTLDSDPTYNKFWTYLVSSGTYPDLAVTSSSAVYVEAAQLPIIPLREGFKSINSTTPQHPAYQTSKKILDIINLDIDDLIDQVESNENLDQISNAFVLFGLNIYSETQAGQKALYTMFRNLFVNQEVTKAVYDANPPEADPIFNTVRMTEQSFNTIIGWNYITIDNIVGTIGLGKVGTYEIEVDVLPNSPVEEDEETGETTGGGVNSTYTLRKMIAPNLYEELVIHGMFQSINVITEDGKIRAYLNELTTDVAKKQNFIMPLPYYIFKGGLLDAQESETVIYEALTMVIYASEHIHLEYYETEAFLNFFAIIIEVAAVVVLIVSLGSAASFSHAVLVLAEQLLYQYALTLVLEELLYLAGDSEIARALAFVAYAAASYYGVNRATGGMTIAEDLLFTVNALSQAATIELEFQADELQQEIDAWIVSSQERQEELDKAQALLDNNTGLSLEEMITYMPIDPYETPNDFYDRTIHTGNPGVITLSQIETYHDNLLTLPELGVHSFDPVSPYG